MRKLLGALLLALVLGASFAQAPSGIGDWFIHSEVDPFTDEELRLAFVLPTTHPTLGRDDMFGVVCGPSPYSVDGIGFMLLGSAYISTPTTPVMWRVDSLEPVQSPWWVSEDTNVLPHRPERITALTAALLDGETLAVRYEAYRGPQTYVFPVAGFREVLAELGCYTGEL